MTKNGGVSVCDYRHAITAKRAITLIAGGRAPFVLARHSMVTTNYKKWQLVSSHTARRTFASLEYLAGTPTVTIMAVTGHKTTSAFLSYLKLSPDEHAKIMQLHWEKRQKAQLKAV